MGDISRQFRHLMWYVFAGSSGGLERVMIMGVLRDRPSNTSHLQKKLGMSPSDLIHNIGVLVENGIVEVSGKKGDDMFFPSEMFERESATFDDILGKLGLDPKKDIDWKDFSDSYDTPVLWGDSD